MRPPPLRRAVELMEAMVTAQPWGEAVALRYPGLSADLATGVVHLTYDIEGTTGTRRFTETLTFPVPDQPPGPAATEALGRVLELLYVAGGTSYYKLAAPPRVHIDAVALAEPALAWARGLFHEGLAEFAYRNDLPHVVTVPIDAAPAGGGLHGAGLDGAAAERDRALGDRSPLVAVGGGKDSIVTIEALKRSGANPVLFAVKPNRLITAVMEAAGLPTLAVGRALDPELFALTATGYNGHIPVTAINSLIGVAAALLHGHGPVVMSNERSASIANLVWNGHEVNHQWSKSLAAEGLLRDALAVHAGLSNTYFSLLRGLSELHIAQLFASITAYDAVVSSCNRAFRIGADSPRRWCADCDKCRFVFLALAPFVDRSRLVEIFDADMLADDSQLPGYRELCGISAHKPFECVGETDECLVALRILVGHPDWAGAPVVHQLAGEVPADRWPSEAETARVFDGAGPDFVPPSYRSALWALAGAGLARATRTDDARV